MLLGIENAGMVWKVKDCLPVSAASACTTQRVPLPQPAPGAVAVENVDIGIRAVELRIVDRHDLVELGGRVTVERD